MESGGHSHGSGCSCAGFELTDKGTPGSPDDDLFEVIEVDKVKCLNEREIGSCQKVFRPAEDRARFGAALRPAEGDPELLLVIPFSEEVKVRAIALICGEGKPEGAGLYARVTQMGQQRKLRLQPRPRGGAGPRPQVQRVDPLPRHPGHDAVGPAHQNPEVLEGAPAAHPHPRQGRLRGALLRGQRHPQLRKAGHRTRQVRSSGHPRGPP